MQQRPKLNFNGATVTDSAILDMTTVQYDMPQAGHIIFDEGATLAQKTGLNFIGDGVSVVNDGTYDRTNVTIGAGFNVVEQHTVGFTMTSADFSKVIVMGNPTPVEVTLPSINALDIGKQVTISRSGLGALTIRAQAGQYIVDSTAGGSLTNSVEGEGLYAIVVLKTILDGRWHILSGNGTWVSA
jgi:hypothetical protein